MARLGKVLFCLILSSAMGFAESPRWITKDNCYNPENAGRVVEVIAGENADLVVIDTGLKGNMRIGAVCAATNPDRTTAKVVVVEATENESIALIITNTEIQQGAAVHITAN